MTGYISSQQGILLKLLFVKDCTHHAKKFQFANFKTGQGEIRLLITATLSDNYKTFCWESGVVSP